MKSRNLNIKRAALALLWIYCPLITPSKENGSSDTDQLTYPIFFVPAGGTYFSEQRVEIHYEAEPATAVVIRYTLDGREPVESDPIVTTWIPISSNTLLTAKAWITEIWDFPILEGQVIPVLPTTFEVGRARYWIHEGELELRVKQPALGEIRLTWQPMANWKYQIQASHDLVAWSDVLEPVIGNGSVIEVPLGRQEPSASLNFFRLRTVPLDSF